MGLKYPDRRDFLKRGAALAGGLTLGGVEPAIGQTPASDQDVEIQDWSSPELIAYGERSRFVTSVREPHGGRPSPDAFGLVFHVATPLQDSVGVITPSSLHFTNTTRGSYVPDIDPREHRFMIHGMVDRPLIFTMEDLKRLPSVTRLHFIECAGNRASSRHTTVQETHGNTSCAEWTGVLLSALLNEAGVKDGGGLDRGGRGRGSERGVEHSVGEGDGRLRGVLRHERRGGASPAGLPPAAAGAGLRRNI